MATSSVTAAQAYKAALVDAMTALVADQEVLVTFGHPGREVANWHDIVSFADTSSAQQVATMGTNRSREETLTQKVWISCERAGDQDQERVASDAAYALLGLLEHHVRVTDTTLGGVVRQCFLTSHTATGETDPKFLDYGRLIEIEAEFTALVRVTGP
ncbi:MAG TPA: hypothetical protein VMV41_08725 [Cellulomonadaceae bacterium]|nr:hypothetical protein [Cellulomonadaceae bacterium]